jgi:hypothetical protein
VTDEPDEKKKDEALASWPTPVYSDAPPRNLEQFAICKHCNTIRMDHIDDECLFDSTKFEAKVTKPTVILGTLNTEMLDDPKDR